MTQSDKAIAAAEIPARRIDPTTVRGWGVDADPENDPTWPMRDRSKDDGPGMNWTPPEPQVADVEILQSVEHNRRPASVGTSTPPTALSGVFRRQAFKLSESQWGHWLLLMLADRINTIEGVFQDIGQGSFPNVPVEMGMVKRSRSRESAIASGVVVVAMGVAAVALWRGARRR